MKRVILIAAVILLALPRAALAEVDKAFVGTWKTTIQTPAGPWEIVWDVRANGTYYCVFKGNSAPPPEDGTVTAAGGRWSLRSVFGRVDAGTYRSAGGGLSTVNGVGYPASWVRVPQSEAKAPPSQQEKMQPRTFAASAPRDFTFFRKEADAYAQGINSGFQLFMVQRWGSNAGGRLEADETRFFYYVYRLGRAENGSYDILTVHVTPQGLSGDMGRNVPAFEPKGVAPKVISDEEAFRKLLALNPNMPPNMMYLDLICVGVLPAPVTQPEVIDYQALGCVVSGMDNPALTGRWVWRMMALRAGGVGMGSKEANRHTEFIYVDAQTGQPLSAAAGPLPGGKPHIPGRTRPR